MNLTLLDPAEVDAGGCVCLRDARARHLLHVIGADRGQTMRVGIINGPVGTGTVVDIAADSVTLRCELGETPPRPSVDLLLALPRPKVLRRLWAQLAAMGIDRIILTNAARVERNYFDTHVVTEACYGPLLVEGLQQARDTRVPAVSIHRQFRKLVEDDLATLSDATSRVVAEPGATTSVRQAVANRRHERVLLAVGPEGGWNDFELTLLDAHAFQRVGMGNRTLRSDTATIALLAILGSAIRD